MNNIRERILKYLRNLSSKIISSFQNIRNKILIRYRNSEHVGTFINAMDYIKDTYHVVVYRFRRVVAYIKEKDRVVFKKWCSIQDSFTDKVKPKYKELVDYIKKIYEDLVDKIKKIYKNLVEKWRNGKGKGGGKYKEATDKLKHFIGDIKAKYKKVKDKIKEFRQFDYKQTTRYKETMHYIKNFHLKSEIRYHVIGCCFHLYRACVFQAFLISEFLKRDYQGVPSNPYEPGLTKQSDFEFTFWFNIYPYPRQKILLKSLIYLRCKLFIIKYFMYFYVAFMVWGRVAWVLFGIVVVLHGLGY
jgi:hypothetical protein